MSLIVPFPETEPPRWHPDRSERWRPRWHCEVARLIELDPTLDPEILKETPIKGSCFFGDASQKPKAELRRLRSPPTTARHVRPIPGTRPTAPSLPQPGGDPRPRRPAPSVASPTDPQRRAIQTVGDRHAR